MRALIVMLAAILAGCASPSRIMLADPVEIKIPVRVPCIKTVPAAPVWAFNPAADASTYALVDNLLIEREQRRIYEAELMAVMRGCE